MQHQPTARLVLIGKVSSVHGIKGHVIIQSFTDPAGSICKLPLLNADNFEVKLKFYGTNTKHRLICNINDIIDRTSAEKLIGTELFCLQDHLPKIEDKNEFYVKVLKNLAVVDQELKPIGVVKNFFNFGAGDIIEIQFTTGDRQLFPFTKTIFPEITNSYMLMIMPKFL